MLKRVEDYVSKWDMLKKEDKVIAGVSGGADSVCLLFVLLELQENISFELIVVHVNHGLRGEDADADERFVKKICREKEIPCLVYSEDVETIANERKQSIEEAGRNVRREAFEKAMELYGGTKIALAHHMNDNVETFLMNAVRGAGLKGLGGIRPVAGPFIRPLLCLERKDIESFLESRQIYYCTDETNASDAYLRNRVRNQVIPYMEKEMNVRAVSHISETMKQLQEIQNFLEELAKKYYKNCVKQVEIGYIVLERPFAETPEVIRPLVLKEVLVAICNKEKDLAEIHLQSMIELMKKQVGRQIDLPYGMIARRVYKGLLVQPAKLEKEQTPMFEVCFENGDIQEFQWKEKKITCRLLDKVPTEEEQAQKINTKWFDYDIISHSLCIRTRQIGDYITIHPDGRTQKLKSFFINEKIPQEKRDEIMLVVDGQHVLWVEGLRANCKYQTGEHTKRVLEIQIDKGESYGRNN